MPHVDFPQTYCLGAIARRGITPPVGIYHRMWGAATHDRSTGVHRPLTATVLALQPTSSGPPAQTHSSPQVLIAVDHCLIWNEEMDDLRAGVCKAASLAPDQLHIAFSHTHAAGLMDPKRADLPGGELIAPYLAELKAKLADAAREALAALRPVRIMYGRGRCDLACHRDFWDEANQTFVCGYNPEGVADDTVLVARITDEQDRTLGTVVNYACHPTTLAWDNTLISPDYVGAMREVVETATQAPCLFLQGASGDLGPREGFVGDVKVADGNGRRLGYAALAALEDLAPPGQRFEYTGSVVSGATIGTWDYRPLGPEELCQKHRWHCENFVIELPYRGDLPTCEQAAADLARWQAEEKTAHDRGDHERARDCRAQAERSMRQLARLRSLPPGKTVPLEVSLWQLGDAIWIALQGEHYNLLQHELRCALPEQPILIATVTNGWRPGYLPTRETYGRGIYQESIAIVEAGSLETVIDELKGRITKLQGATS